MSSIIHLLLDCIWIMHKTLLHLGGIRAVVHNKYEGSLMGFQAHGLHALRFQTDDQFSLKAN